MHPYTYRIRFLVIHPTMNLLSVKDELSNVPGLNPGRLMNFGYERVSHKGEQIEGTYFDSRWGFDFEASDQWHSSDNKTAPDAIEEILGKIEPYKELFRELAKSGCDTELILSIGLDNNAGELFTQTLLQRLLDF